jgi:hypothetical protein
MHKRLENTVRKQNPRTKDKSNLYKKFAMEETMFKVIDIALEAFV